MTDNGTTSSARPGWYHDVRGSSQARWWDGSQWTDQVRDAAAAPVPSPGTERAPSGTSPYNLWVWLATALVVLALVPIGTFDLDSYLLASMDPYHTVDVLLSPGYLMLVGSSFILYGLTIVFAWFDWRDQRTAGVPRPFAWAFAFLGPVVYLVGRSIVVRRRTGSGLAPLWICALVVLVACVLLVAKLADAVAHVLPYYLQG